MLYFRDVPWLRINGGRSVFRAYISIGDREREDIMWTMALQYIAAGAAWRRVHQWERPLIWIEVNHFRPPAHSWTDLEHAHYWDLPDENMPFNDYIMEYKSPAGGIEAHYYPRCGSEADEQLELYDVVWRVAARNGRWFTVELAALYDGRETQRDLRGRPVVVTPDGKGEKADADAEFWKKHATFYLVEDIPFGVVIVRVPRNARDPEAYAFSRAQELVGGLPLPDYIEIGPNREPKKEDPLGLASDRFVTLHFNDYYEP